MNNYNQKKRLGSNNRNRRENDNQKNKYSFEEIDKPLHVVFSDPKDLYLPGGKAYKCAEDFKNINSNPIRKVLDGVKNALYNPDEKNAIKNMYVLVAMTAYNSGRNKDLVGLYEFLKNTINEKSITNKKDIKAFDEFFTSVVAYHKSIVESRRKKC